MYAIKGPPQLFTPVLLEDVATQEGGRQGWQPSRLLHLMQFAGCILHGCIFQLHAQLPVCHWLRVHKWKQKRKNKRKFKLSSNGSLLERQPDTIGSSVTNFPNDILFCSSSRHLTNYTADDNFTDFSECLLAPNKVKAITKRDVFSQRSKTAVAQSITSRPTALPVCPTKLAATMVR